nr:tetratricopeptide repeat protein [Candidatus Sigynarchaeota archaeon]
MPDDDSDATRALYTAERLENRGDYAGACKIIQEALEKHPENDALAKKYKDLLATICWRC